jgi:hypothetical protein
MKIRSQPGQPQHSLGAGSSSHTAQSLFPQKLRPEAAKPQGPFEALDALARRCSEEESAQRDPVRWPLEKMPLGVFIEPFPEADFDFLPIMRQWEVASQGLIRFRPVLNAQDADIVFSWSGETVCGRDYEVGHANRTVQGRRIKEVAITLIREPLVDTHLSPSRRKQRIVATILHETGHALGLEHSDRQEDVMHHRGWQRTALSGNDARRIQDLYRLNAFLSG